MEKFSSSHFSFLILIVVLYGSEYENVIYVSKYASEKTIVKVQAFTFYSTKTFLNFIFMGY